MKVAIIGGGILGEFLAWKLAEKNVKVYLFERSKDFGKKACSTLVSERIFDFIPQTKELIRHEIEGVLIFFPKKTIEVKFKKRFFVFEREEIEKLLFNLANESGAKIFRGINLKSLPENFDKIIGADGALSLVRRSLKLPEPELFLGIQGFKKEKNFSSFAKTWPTKFGFLWEIPRGEKTEWGIVEKPKLAKKIFEDFLKEKNVSLDEIKASIIPHGFILTHDQKVFLVGDSQGLTKPWSYGGIIWGLKACEILIRNFPDFLKTESDLKKFFLPQIFLSSFSKKIVYFFGFNFPKILSTNYEIDGDFFFDSFLKP